MQVRDSFVGRHAELADLRAAVDASVDGRGSLVLLAGEPGIGKTRLAEITAEYARSAGCGIRWASCWDGPAAPFWPWTQLIRAQLFESGATAPAGDIARLAGEATDAPASEGVAEPVRFALFDAVTSFFRSAATDEPLLLVVDDLHWAGVPSLLLLEFLARDVRDVPVVVLGTFRDIEVEPDTDIGLALGRLIEGGRLIHLEGLPATEVAELLAATSGALAETDFARAVYEQSGGNPLFVNELARLMRSQGRPLSGSALRVPEGVNAVIQRRVARLSQACHNLLSVAAVLGPQFGLVTLSRTAEVPADQALALLGDAQAARLVVPATGGVGRYEFSHALVRTALYESLPMSRRVDLHRRAAEALEEMDNAGSYVDELAYHYVHAAPGGSAGKAVSYSVEAGRRAAEQLAFESSAAHFQRAIDVLDLEPDDDRKTGILLELGDARLRAGDVPAARDVFEAAADLARRRGRAEDLARAALGFGAGLGGFEIQLYDVRQIELLEESLEAVGPSDTPLRAWLAARMSVALSYQESIERRRLLAEEAVDIARRVNEASALAYALAAHCDSIAGPDQSETRFANATEIIGIARAQRDRPLELLGRRLRIVAQLEMGDIAGADKDIEAFARVADLIRQPLYLWYVSLWRGMRAQVEGRLDEARALADGAAEIGARAHSTNAAMLTAVLRCHVEYDREHFDAALDEARTLYETAPEVVFPYAYVTEAWLNGRAGRLQEARGWLAQIDLSPTFVGLDSEWLSTMCQASGAIDALGDAGLAETLYGAMLPYRSRVGVEGIGASLHGSLELHLGYLARAAGNADAAEEHFVSAIDANRRIGAPLLAARAQLELAGVIAGRDPDRASQLTADAESARAALGIGAAAPAEQPSIDQRRFVREGEFWTLSFEGTTVRVKDAKGLHDLAKLLALPGRELAALDLAASSSGTSARATGADLHTEGHAGELLDEQARNAYKERLADLEDEISEADELGNSARAERARAERDALAHELASAYGLGGRARRAGDPAERARTTVTRRIRDAMSRIEEVHPALGRHLRKSVRTGTFCAYDPEEPASWVLTT